MMNWISTFPLWFWMIIITVIVITMGYRLATHGIKIKAGPVEIDATEEDKPEAKNNG